MGWVLLVTVYVAFMSRGDASSRQSRSWARDGRHGQRPARRAGV